MSIFFIVGAPNVMRSVNSAGLVVDPSGNIREKEGTEAMSRCLKLLYPSLNETNSTYEDIWQLIPSFRYVGLCPHDASMVGMLLEMQAHLGIIYSTNNGKVFPFHKTIPWAL